MTWALIASLAIVFSGSAALPTKVALKTVASSEAKGLAQSAASDRRSSNYDRSAYDSQAEEELFDLANQDRARAGLAPLQLDPSLTQAARGHAAEMAEQQQLSHQLNGEPAFAQRLAATGDLRLDRAGENEPSKRPNNTCYFRRHIGRTCSIPTTTSQDSQWRAPRDNSTSSRTSDTACLRIHRTRRRIWWRRR